MDVAVERYTGSHRDLAWSFGAADDSQELLNAYIDLGLVWVAREAGGAVIGHLQVVPRDEEVWEVTTPPSSSRTAVAARVAHCWSAPSMKLARQEYAA